MLVGQLIKVLRGFPQDAALSTVSEPWESLAPGCTAALKIDWEAGHLIFYAKPMGEAPLQPTARVIPIKVKK